jgi:tetratricopeptide (TPR) repeat protein
MRLPAFPRLLALSLVILLVAGCGKEQPAAHIEVPENGPAASATLKPASSADAIVTRNNSPDSLIKLLDLATDKEAQLTKEERCDAALLEALARMADRNYGEALTALEKAREAQDTEAVRREIERVKKLLQEQKDAEQTQLAVQAVLADGKPEDAARLAIAGLQQYGGGETGEALAQLKRQADALVAAADNGAARRAQLVSDGDNACRDKNFRAAVVAYEQALVLGDDPGLRGRLDEVRATLTRYDEQRQRARDLRRDPANLEQALAALQAAAAAWDTPQVREDIDECTLALQKRRDRISVADFEVRGDIGIPAVGRTVAENLLPAFRPRFDLVEREQIGQVLSELRLEASDMAASDEARQQVGRLARVRYLVVGSITPLCGITVNARLVEVQTGLVVQTAKLIASDPDDLMRRLPKLALMLQMTDEQKLAFEAELAQAAAGVIQPAAIAPPPPPPPMPAPGVVLVAPPPILVFTPVPAPLGGIVIADFDRLPPPPPEREGFSFDLFLGKESPVKSRMLSVHLELGDNLFRRGRYQEAQSHFELAFSLSKGHSEVSVRLDRCRQLAPPPPPAPVVVAPVVVVRPRIAVFNFVVDSPPGLVPAGCDNWAADQLAASFMPAYEVIDRGEVCWWMGRLGITMRDVCFDPTARAALAQSLGARFFVFGSMRYTSSFDVTTHMVDAQTGAKTGGGFIHVQDHNELKLRAAELVGQTTGTPVQAKQLADAGRENEKALNEARQFLKAGKYAEASAAARAGLAKSPNNVALRTVQTQADQLLEKARLEEAHRQEAARLAVQAEAARKQQQDLAKQAEAARLRAQQEAKSRDESAKRAQEIQKQRAFDNLVAQAHTAARTGNTQQAVSFYDSALALKADPSVKQERDAARSLAAQMAKAKADQEKAQREAEAEKKREAALSAARAQVEVEKKQREAETAQKQKDQQARDAAERSRLIEQARGFLTRGQYDAAMGALQTARRLGKSDEVDKLAAQVQAAQARAESERKNQQQANAEKKLAAEKAAQAKAEAEKKAQHQAEMEKRIAADKTARDKAEAEKKAQQKADADRKAAADKAARDKAQADYAQAMKAGRDAYAARKLDDAVQHFTQALRLMPGDRDATACLQTATKVRDDMKKAPPAPPAPPAEYTRQMDAAATLEKQQKFGDAVLAYKMALRVVPGDAKATKGADFAQHMADGQKALTARKFPDAVREFEAALRVMPGNADATALLKRAKEGR